MWWYLEVMLQDLQTASHIWHGHCNTPVKAAWPGQSWVQSFLHTIIAQINSTVLYCRVL